MIITYFVCIINIITLVIAADSKTNLFVETLIVIDATTYKYFTDLFGSNLPSFNINSMMKDYFSGILSAVSFCKKIENSLMFNLKCTRDTSNIKLKYTKLLVYSKYLSYLNYGNLA